MFGRFPGFDGPFFDDFRRARQQMDELFGTWAAPAEIRSLPSGSFPAINVGLTPEKVDVYLFAAGCDPKAFDISLHKSLLTVSGRRELGSDPKASYYRRALRRGIPPRRHPARGRGRGPGAGGLP